MDHHKMAQKLEEKDVSASTMPKGTGTVMSVDAANHSIKIAHDPIAALGWPKMKMSFTADKAIDLSSFKEGDAVSFALKPVGKDDYTILNLKKAQ